MVYVNILLVVTYVCITIIRCGIPESISAMVYNLDNKWSWVWSVWMFVVSLTLAPCLIEALPDDFQFLAFLTVALLALVGTVPLFEKEMRRWHYILAIAAGVLSQVCVAIANPWLLLSWVAIVPFLKNNRIVFVSEVICWVTMIVTSFIQ